MHPETDAKLRLMPLDTQADAVLYMEAYRRWLRENSPYGMRLLASFKPATVRAPDLVDKASRAEVLAQACYWQMPYEKAQRHFYGLPRSEWAAERVRRGMAV
jgi:hypothetical protein